MKRTFSNLVEVDDYYIDPDTYVAEWGGKPRCLAAALTYAARGWQVFPAPRGTKKSHKAAKHSDGRNWGKTSDPDQIRRDFTRWPNANVGIPTGKENGFWVLEADTPEGHDVDGIASLRELEAQHGKLPVTLMVESPSGSIHYYFKYPSDGTEICNSASEVAPGIDVRGEGGMVIAPPSVKPGTKNGAYTWINNVELVDAPDWLLDRVKMKKRANVDREWTQNDEPSTSDLDSITAALAATPSDNYQVWFENGCALHREMGYEEGFKTFDRWSRKSKKYDEHECKAKWEECAKITAYTTGTIYHHADAADPGWRERCFEMVMEGLEAAARNPEVKARMKAELGAASGQKVEDRGDDGDNDDDDDAPAQPRTEQTNDEQPQQHTSQLDVTDEIEIDEINHEYALVLAGNKASIMKLEGGTNFRLLQVSAFKQWFANRHIKVGKKVISVAELWLGHLQRRQYEGIEFAPGGGRHGYYNLWRGFAVEPREGDCSKFLAHLHDNVAQGNETHYNWVVAWFAQIMQQPTVKPGTSLALRGKMGVGKTKVGQVFGSLIGDNHYALVADPRYIVGQFNSHMASLLLLHADEAFWAGDKRAEGKLRDLVTGHRHFLEFKGVDPILMANLIRLFVTGDRDWLVPAGFGERRFAVLDVGEDHMQDLAYFAAIDEEMDHGGREALLYHLLNFDLSRVDLRVIPKTAALLQQQIQSATPEQAWWLDTLRSGKLPRGTDEANTCLKNILFRRYIQHANLQGVRRKVIQTTIGMFLNRYVGSELKSNERLTYNVISSNGNTITKRGWCYRFPSLKDCRERFAKEMQQQDIEWGDVTEWHHEDEPIDLDDEPL